MSQDTAEQSQSTASAPPPAIIRPPRLPYHPAIEERFGVDRSGWKALVEAIFPLAKSPDAVVMALSYCKARRLDPFKRPVHIVPMWSAAAGEMVETVWPGISELRTTAFRTGQYSGMDAAEFGPMITRTFEGTSHKGRTKGTTRKIDVTFPEWCQITIWRVLNGVRIQFVSPKVYWLESYGKWTDTDVPNDMWAKRPVGQIEKCAEAAGLRRAFPEEIGNDYAAEEMEGQRLGFAAPAEKLREGPSLSERLKASASGSAGFDATSSVPTAGQIIDHDEETGEITDDRVRGHSAEAADAREIVHDGYFVKSTTDSSNAAGTALPPAGEHTGPDPQTRTTADSGPVTGEQADDDTPPRSAGRRFVRSDLRKGEE